MAGGGFERGREQHGIVIDWRPPGAAAIGGFHATIERLQHVREIALEAERLL